MAKPKERRFPTADGGMHFVWNDLSRRDVPLDSEQLRVRLIWDCFSTNSCFHVHMKHLLVFGGGSAAITGALRAIEAGWTVTLANNFIPIGGTCLNVGCVPSKYYIRAAEALHRAQHGPFPGVNPKGADFDFAALAAGCKALVTELRATNYEDRLPEIEDLRLIEGTAALEAGPNGPVMQVNGEAISGDAALVATGCYTVVPPISGLADTPYLTNTSLFDLTELPKSMVVLGAGYIALECAQMMQRFGVDVTVLQRSSHVLSDQPARIGDALQAALEADGVRVLTDTDIEHVSYAEDQFRIRCSHGEIVSDAAFLGLGRAGRTDGLSLTCNAKGYVEVDDYGQSSMPNVYAAGDVCGDFQFVYAAAYQAEVAIDHLLGRDTPKRAYISLPWVVFTDPQVAGVGLDEAEAREAGHDVDVAEQPVARWPRFRVACQSEGFLKLIRDRKTDQLLGARIVCPEAGDLVGEISLAIRHGITVSELSRTLHPYLTLSEGIELAAGKF